MRKVLHFLDLLDDVDTEWMAVRGSRCHVSAGTVLIQEGEEIDAIYFVLDGEFVVRVAAAGNKEIATLLSGEIVGEMSFVDSRPPTASVVAARDSQILRIPRELLNEKLAKDQGFAARFYRGIATFLSDRLHVTVGRLGYGAAEQDRDPSELDDQSIERISLAATRFDGMLRRLQTT
jgi:CRP/FNR family transcriptional regulator, cyclic AMP receptor protein